MNIMVKLIKIMTKLITECKKETALWPINMWTWPEWVLLMYVKCKKWSKNTVNQLKFKRCSHKLFSYTHLYNSSHFTSWLKICWSLQYHLPTSDTLNCNFDAVAYKTICTHIQLIENVLFRWIFRLSTFRNWKQKKRIQNGEASQFNNTRMQVL